MYFAIVRKLFPTVEFDRIFTLNGKRGVIEKAKKSLRKRNRVFIVDKDFDDLLKIQRNDLPNLFYLKKYSIENYFLEEYSILMLIVSQMPTINRKKLKFKLEPIKRQVIKELKSLSCYFYIVQKNRIPNVKAASLPLEMFMSRSNEIKLDQKAIRKYKTQISNGLLRIKLRPCFLKELSLAKQEIDYDSNNIINNIPGKHCLTLVAKILKRKYPKIGNLHFEKMCYALATNCTFKELEYLQQDIERFLRI